MKQLDKMLKQARKSHARRKEIDLNRKIDPHILEDGYCYSCEGECRYKEHDDYFEAGKYKAIFVESNDKIDYAALDRTPIKAFQELINELERQIQEDEADGADGAEKEDQVKTG